MRSVWKSQSASSAIRSVEVELVAAEVRDAAAPVLVWPNYYFFFSGLSAGQVQSIQAPRKPVQKTPPASGPSYTRLGADRAKNMPAPRPPAFAPSAQPNCPCRIVLATAPGSGPSGALGPRHPNCAGTSLPFSQHSDSPPPPNHHLANKRSPSAPRPNSANHRARHQHSNATPHPTTESCPPVYPSKTGTQPHDSKHTNHPDHTPGTSRKESAAGAHIPLHTEAGPPQVPGKRSPRSDSARAPPSAARAPRQKPPGAKPALRPCTLGEPAGTHREYAPMPPAE